MCEGTNYASIFSGSGNIANGHNSFIGGGDGNIIDSPTYGLVNCSSILGGWQNVICDNGTTGLGSFSVIAGGYSQQILSGNSFIGGGANHCVDGLGSGIATGDANWITCSSPASFIGGGAINRIGSATPGAGSAFNGAIVGGSWSRIDTAVGVNSFNDIIGGGDHNCICAGSNCSAIFGGDQNCVSGNWSMIGGGHHNIIGDITGLVNTADCSFIGGGSGNFINANGANTTFGVIGGGQANLLAPGTNHSSVFGGHGNNVLGNCSVVLGGQTNVINSDYSSIIGGNGNSIPAGAGFINRHIIGSAIALGAGVGYPNSLHINGLWANGIPNAGLGPFPVGTVFWNAPGAPIPFIPPPAGILWIM